MNPLKHDHTNRDGGIIFQFAFLLPLLIMILGFTVDYASMQKARNEVRVVADLAAQAATGVLARTGGDADAARAAARFIATHNLVAGKQLILRDDQIIFGRTSQQPDGSYVFNNKQTPFNSVQVTARRPPGSSAGPIAQFFGQFYSRPTFNAVQSTRGTFREFELVLVLDRSSSMKFDFGGPTLPPDQREQRICSLPVRSSRWLALNRAVEVFLKELQSTPSHKRVGLVTFSETGSKVCGGNRVDVEKATLDAPLEQDLNTVGQSMDRLNNTIWFGGTNLTAGLSLARSHFNTSASQNVDRIILCVTDGADSSGTHPLAEVQRCQADGITVHAITLGDEANQQDMRRVCEIGGGHHFHASNAKALNNIFKRLAGTFGTYSQ